MGGLGGTRPAETPALGYDQHAREGADCEEALGTVGASGQPLRGEGTLLQEWDRQPWRSGHVSGQRSPNPTLCVCVCVDRAQTNPHLL